MYFFFQQETQCSRIYVELARRFGDGGGLPLVEGFPWNGACWGGVVFGRRVKQCRAVNFRFSFGVMGRIGQLWCVMV